jgi:hypothetical protein
MKKILERRFSDRTEATKEIEMRAECMKKRVQMQISQDMKISYKKK